MYKIYVFSLFLTYSALSSISDEFQFDGQEFWDDESRNLCDDVELDTTWQWEKAVCFEYFWNYQAVKMEVIAWRPGLVIYRDLFTGKQVEDYLRLMEEQEFEEQQVVDDDGTEFYSKVRKANGTQIIAKDFPAALSIFNTVKNLMPNLDFKYAEDIVALSYHPGGHYATHHDYLEYPSEKEWDAWMRNYGNRFGTLIM
ncbi:hypothetical protein CRE_06013 [Caenorhabditis remanei]|uniref:Prolyl 4-hydroxylase alpha subunit domain-containing protein n=1 Tax=Caenorhabditis remanei TaxID=31234 RepID=E3N6H1_CAERE|nr:hypothetical protein CRE_06013 [Caenorhabditis remanei]